VYYDPAEPDGLRKALAERNLKLEDVKITEPFKPAKSPMAAVSKAPRECPPRRKTHSFFGRLFPNFAHRIGI
jgi:hypothetical protein